MTEIVDVKGIGPATAVTFVKHGFSTAADIATAKIKDLAGIPGVKEARARALVEAARALLSDMPGEKQAVKKGKKKFKKSDNKKKGKKSKNVDKPNKPKKKNKKKKKGKKKE